MKGIVRSNGKAEVILGLQGKFKLEKIKAM
jgi:hypothetical protein